MKNFATPRSIENNQSALTVARIAFRKRVELQVLGMPERLFGIKKNSFKLRLSNRFILLLLRKGLNITSSAKDIRTALEKLLLSPLSRLLSCGQLTFGDVLIIRTNKANSDIEIERVNKRQKRIAPEENHPASFPSVNL